MPGIVGLITRAPRERAEPQLARMVEAIRHESFYKTGTWIDESMGVYVGWTALQGSLGAGMPLRNDRGDATLLFSGDEFSEPDAPSQCDRRSCVSGAHGPSYLVRRYENDPTFPASLNGRFHGLVTDRRRGIATLFNDRYGMHKIYYHEAKEGLYFAAEAKAILAVRPELRTVDPRGLGELVSCGCVMENRTLFNGIHLLPPASAWTLEHGAITRRDTYFHPREWEEQPSLDEESYYTEIRQIFSRRIARYFDGQEQIGMSLTGGLDTRMIMSWYKATPGSLPCYTFGGTYQDCRDVIIARRVASACQQPHEVITVGNELLSRFSSYAERTVYLTDGCADVSRSAALFANEKAREIAPVRMGGVYGSEILRRLRSYKPSDPTPGLYNPEFVSKVDAAKETYRGLLKLHPLSFTAFSQTPQRAVDVLEQSQVGVRFPFLDNDLVRTAFRAPSLTVAKNDASADNDVCLRLIRDGNADLGRIRTDRGLGGAPGFVSAVSRAFQEFTFKSEYAYDYGMPQFVAQIDHLISPLRPERLFLGRHKFAHFRVWYRDPLAKYVQEILLDSRSLARPYLDRKGVESVVRSHLKGNRNYTSAIHRLLSLELLHRLFVDGR
jgi:asparagine synthase (glutamine-hydrolysing)